MTGFRERIMFPICRPLGAHNRLWRRALAKDVAAKYLKFAGNSAVSQGGVLYNHHAARKAAP